MCVRSVPCQSLYTTGALTLQELPFAPCLNPAHSAWLQLQDISSSLHLHLGSGYLTDFTTGMMTTFFHLLLVVSTLAYIMPSLSILLASPFDVPGPGPFPVSLSCPICVSSATTCPALQSRSSGSVHLQHKGILLTAGLLYVVTFTSVNNFYVQITAIISGNSTAHCVVWSPRTPRYVGYSFAELCTPKSLRYTSVWWYTIKKHFLHCPW